MIDPIKFYNPDGCHGSMEEIDSPDEADKVYSYIKYKDYSALRAENDRLRNMLNTFSESNMTDTNHLIYNLKRGDLIEVSRDFKIWCKEYFHHEFEGLVYTCRFKDFSSCSIESFPYWREYTEPEKIPDPIKSWYAYGYFDGNELVNLRLYYNRENVPPPNDGVSVCTVLIVKL